MRQDSNAHAHDSPTFCPFCSVVWFANKPQRDAGAVPLPAIATPAFASVWEAGPNAALVGTTPAGRRVTVTLALAAPAHDPAARTLTFNASALAPPAFVVAGAGGQEGTAKGGSAAAAAVTDDGRPLVLHGATLFVDQFNGFGSVPMGPGYSGTSCLLPAGCLLAVVCGWCPSRWGGAGWGWG